MNSTTTQRMPLKRGRRIALSVTLSKETHTLLAALGEGNRSAAIEELARLYRERALEPAPV
jgi:hypothetical protein